MDVRDGNGGELPIFYEFFSLLPSGRYREKMHQNIFLWDIIFVRGDVPHSFDGALPTTYLQVIA